MKTLSLFFVLGFSTLLVQAQQAIKVEKTGKGEPTIFLPGFTCPGAVWDETIAQLKGKRQVFTVSYAGFNGIEPIGTPWYTVVREQLINYIKDADLKNVSIVGHSMGGTLALEVAAALPDKVTRIVAVDALPCLRELWMPGVSADQIAYDNPYSKQMLAMDAEAFKNNAAMIAGSMTNKEEKKPMLIDWMLAADRTTYVNGYTDLLKVDARPQLSQIKAKTLVIGASFPDKNAVMANMEKQYANLADTQIVIADNSLHFVMFDQPEWFYGQLNAFLAK